MGLTVRTVRPTCLGPLILAPSELAVFYGGKYSKILLRYIFPVFISIFISQLFNNPEAALDLGRNPIDSEWSANVRFGAHNGLKTDIA
jgi:hypothetical protein